MTIAEHYYCIAYCVAFKANLQCSRLNRRRCWEPGGEAGAGVGLGGLPINSREIIVFLYYLIVTKIC